MEENSIIESSRLEKLELEKSSVAKSISGSVVRAIFKPIETKVDDLVKLVEQYANFLVSKNQDDQTILEQQPKLLQAGQLKNYQMDGLNWMISLYECGINGILADEMGLGKTIQTIALIAFLKENKKIHRHHLIIAPKSTIGNWEKEFKKWLPSCEIIRTTGEEEERNRAIPLIKKLKFDVLITTYEAVIILHGVIRSINFIYLIADEAHRLKNDETVGYQSLFSLKCKQKLFLTGTPLQNNPHELWALLSFLMPNLFKSSDVFDSWFSVQTQQEGLDPESFKKRNLELVNKFQRVLRPFMLRRTKNQVEQQLPKKKEIHLFVKLTQLQRELYRKVLINEPISATKTNLNNKLMQLRKTCLHPYLFPDVEDKTLPELGEHLITNSGKVKVLDKLLQMLHKKHQVLIFSQFVIMLNILEDYCTYRKYPYCRIDGDTKIDDRENQISEFQEPKSKKFIFLLSTRAGGLGITLTNADRVIIFDSDFNPQQDLQAMDRAHRIGQKNPVLVYRLVCENTVEVKIIERQQIKLKWDKIMVQRGARDQRSLLKEDISNMINFGAHQILTQEEETEESIEEILRRSEELTNKMNQEIDEKLGIQEDQFDLGLKQINIYEYMNENVKKDDEFLQERIKELQKQQKPAQSNVKIVKPEEIAKKVSVTQYQLYKQPQLVEQLLNRRYLCEAYEQLDLKVPDDLKLSSSEQKSLTKQLALGFEDWTEKDFKKFKFACIKHGRQEVAEIADYVQKPADEIKQYLKRFEEEKHKFQEVYDEIVKAEAAAQAKNQQIQNLSDFIKGAKKIDEIAFDQKSYWQITRRTVYNARFDRILLIAADQCGIDNISQIKENMLENPYFDGMNMQLKFISEQNLRYRLKALLKIISKESLDEPIAATQTQPSTVSENQSKQNPKKKHKSQEPNQQQKVEEVKSKPTKARSQSKDQNMKNSQKVAKNKSKKNNGDRDMQVKVEHSPKRLKK